MDSSSLRRLLVGPTGSLGAQARQRRWQVFREMFPDVESMRVLDLGGTPDFWLRAPIKPAAVTVINLDKPEFGVGQVTHLTGDACNASEVLSQSAMSADFDLVFSNSLIEHVGGHARRCELAAEIHKLAPRRWIQTPYRYFVLEPHWLFPGMQFLPAAARIQVARHWSLGGRSANVRDAAVRVLETELLSATEMSFYFPDSTIWRERVLGTTKSLVAIKRDSNPSTSA